MTAHNKDISNVLNDLKSMGQETLAEALKLMSEDNLVKGLKLVGEAVLIPGISLFAEGNFKGGLAHFGVGFVAGRFLGAPAAMLVGANSFSLSITGKSLLSHMFNASSHADPSLKKKVQQAISSGRTLEEIIADFAEDIEDIYLENAKSIKRSDADKPHIGLPSPGG